MTGKRRRVQRRQCADSPIPQKCGIIEAPTPPADPSRNLIFQHQTTTQEMEASGASSLSVRLRCHTNRLQHTQPRQRVYEGGTRGALASTRLTTSLAASIPTPHNGRPASWRGGRCHRLGGGGEDECGRGMGEHRSRVRREQEEKEAGEARRALATRTRRRGSRRSETCTQHA
jgi:hypothetical protein